MKVNKIKRIKDCENDCIGEKECRKEAAEWHPGLDFHCPLEDAPEIELTRKGLMIIFKKSCKHLPSYRKGEYGTKFEWQSCNDCILRKVEHGKRDLCFSIWHDEILEIKENEK